MASTKHGDASCWLASYSSGNSSIISPSNQIPLATSYLDTKRDGERLSEVPSSFSNRDKSLLIKEKDMEDTFPSYHKSQNVLVIIVFIYFI